MACAAALTEAVTAYAPDTCTRYLNTPAERILPHAYAAGGASMHAQHICMRRMRSIFACAACVPHTSAYVGIRQQACAA